MCIVTTVNIPELRGMSSHAPPQTRGSFKLH